jgi:hypothetical protein
MDEKDIIFMLQGYDDKGHRCSFFARLVSPFTIPRENWEGIRVVSIKAGEEFVHLAFLSKDGKDETRS